MVPTGSSRDQAAEEAEIHMANGCEAVVAAAGHMHRTGSECTLADLVVALDRWVSRTSPVVAFGDTVDVAVVDDDKTLVAAVVLHTPDTGHRAADRTARSGNPVKGANP